ncbi:nitroreductase/quinone reductase family protein [Arsenicicoccus cauae]|uniref:nitroreductase/quinone reductase family protein n=1 Tax=Arsenicicoccus cauae TaxID=2663847 RepID=UPI0025922905|nr:nitroreductase/quinone reductase family protein [uncultured Arsenicicoccus sp.]
MATTPDPTPGAPEHPQWFHNLVAHPHLRLQDGTTVTRQVARLATDDERAGGWPRCVEAFPPCADYQTETDRQIPTFLLGQP